MSWPLHPQDLSAYHEVCRTRYHDGPKNNLEYKKKTDFWHLVFLEKRSYLRSRNLVLWSLGTLTGQQRFYDAGLVVAREGISTHSAPYLK